MGWFNKSESIDATAGLIKNTGDAFDALFTSDEERAQAKAVFAKIKQRPAAWAHALNLANAQDSSWFNSGWRPAIGWVGAVSLFFFYVPQFIMASFVWVKACLIVVAAYNVGTPLDLPAYPVSDAGLWQLITLLLGGKALRSIEKTEGVNAK
jgi:hypothetical protein